MKAGEAEKLRLCQHDTSRFQCGSLKLLFFEVWWHEKQRGSGFPTRASHDPVPTHFLAKRYSSTSRIKRQGLH